jgi:hypothetical protein
MGMSLCSGTRHRAIYLGEFTTPEEIKAAAAPSANKAFERYHRIKPEQVRSLKEKAQGNVVNMKDQTSRRVTTEPPPSSN